MPPPSLIERTLARCRIDRKPSSEQPSEGRFFVVAVLAMLGSLAADAVIVAIAGHLDHSIKNYPHFRFGDYGTLTVVGVFCACVAWTVVRHVSSSPRWVFFRLAVLVTVVLWIPDLYLFTKHEPAAAVTALMIMHLAVALVTYNLLVRCASSSATRVARTSLPDEAGAFLAAQNATIAPDQEEHLHRSFFLAMMAGVGAEFLVGCVELFYVPLNRPTGWLAHHGEGVYVVHALLGAALGCGALYVLSRALTAAYLAQVDRTAAVGGFLSVAVAALGGVLSYERELRVYAIALMFLGAAVAFFCYLLPLIDEKKGLPTPPPPRGRDGHQGFGEPDRR
jgi:hypothetical protein